ncbi:MAG TPA: hypothetical protein VMA71_00115 [Alloacidobacterium sp.]|nr:hypothetical protein [Alloacidobacterium sp.]
MDFTLFIAGLVFGPYLIAVVLLGVFYLRGAIWRRNKCLCKKRLGFYPTTFALGLAFQMVQIVYEHGPRHLIVEKLKEQAEEDDEGDPEDLTKQLDKQLRRIRRGEEVDTLKVPLVHPRCNRKQPK